EKQAAPSRAPPASGKVNRAAAGAPISAIGYRGGGGIEQDSFGLKAIAAAARAIDAPAITKDGRQAGNENMPVIARTVLAGVQRDFRDWGFTLRRQNQQPHRVAMPAK